MSNWLSRQAPSKKLRGGSNQRKQKHQIIIKMCLEQNQQFAKWDKKKKWNLFHSSHYDWWAFPIDQNSGSYGSAYRVQHEFIRIMVANQQFINALKQNAIMVCRSWGWDLINGEPIKQKQRNQEQRWQRWPIRLSKMCRSLQIFGQFRDDVWYLFVNAIKYAILLLKTWQKFTYGGNNLTPYFYQKHQQIKKQIAKQNDKIKQTKKLQEQKINYINFKDEKAKLQKDQRDNLVDKSSL